MYSCIHLGNNFGFSTAYENEMDTKSIDYVYILK